MKAIIISDDSAIIETVDKILVEHGFSTIIYRWLLKALDNIEEIRPDLVIVSVNEYPRHWKTLTQFVASGIGGDKTKIMLLCQNPLSEEERKKAAALGVKGFFSGIDEDGISQLKSFLNFNFDISETEEEVSASPAPDVENIFDAPVETETEHVESEIVYDVSDAVLLFTNPHSGKMITSKVTSYKNGIVEAIPESRDIVSEIKIGDAIDCLTFEIDSKVQNYTASVISKTDTILIKLVDEING